MNMGAQPITVSNSYNSRLQPAVLSASTSAATIMSLSYDFHSSTKADNGNVFQIVNGRDSNRTENFTYDTLNRLQTAYTNGTNWGETYTIDPWGNLTNIASYANKTGFENLNAAPASASNQLNGFCYDAAGNLALNSSCPQGQLSPTYFYDAENRLISAGGMSYLYDGDGGRVEKCTAGSTPGSCATGATGTLYWRGMGSDPVAETDLAGNLLETYIFFNGQRIARRDASTKLVHYYFSDHLGTHALITDQNGDMPPQEESDYYPYGGEIPVSGSDSNHYKFTGKERDTESGLDNFGARYGASSVGRFMTPDWAANPTTVPYAHLGNPQSLNLYSYVENNPRTFGDPDGHLLPFWNTGRFGYMNVEDVEHWEGQAQAQTTITVSTTKVIGTTTDDLGNKTTVTQTTSVTFSTAKDHEGKFLGATAQTAVHSGGAAGDVIAQSGQVPLSQKEAVQGMGARAFTDAQQSATPNFAQQFGRATAQDFNAHPGKYVFAAVEVLAIFTPLPEGLAAVEGIHEVKAAIDAGVAAGGLSWELTAP